MSSEPKEAFRQNPSKTTRSWPVNEIFGPTLQGEGPLAGAVTHFIRLNGCDFRCAWCDTLDAVLPERIAKHNTIMTTEEVVDKVMELGRAGWVTVSGGNPALFAELNEIIEPLNSIGFDVALETQGSRDPQWWFALLAMLVISPKPPSSKMEWTRDLSETLQRILCIRADHCRHDQTALKVVIFDDADMEWMKAEILPHARDYDINLWLQVGSEVVPPHGIGEMKANSKILIDFEKLAKKVLADRDLYDVRVLPQLHKLIFGHGRGV